MGITPHIKARAKLQTLFCQGGQVERLGRHLMSEQTFIYYLPLQSKDKGNEDDCSVTGEKLMNQPDLTELFTYCNQNPFNTLQLTYSSIYV